MRISDWSSDVCSSDLVNLHRYHAKLHDTSLTAPPQVPSLRFASGVPQGRRRAFGWHKSHPQAPPCVLRAGNRLLHPLIARRNFRSEEHTSELQSLMRISYAAFCLQKNTPPYINTD